MNVSEAYPSRHLSAADLKGNRITLQVASVVLEPVGDGQKLVMSFTGKAKGLVLNKTNANMCAELFASQDSDDWTGQYLVLYPTKVDYQGKRVDAIRIDKAPKTKAPAAKAVAVAPVEEPSDSDIPF